MCQSWRQAKLRHWASTFVQTVSKRSCSYSMVEVSECMLLACVRFSGGAGWHKCLVLEESDRCMLAVSSVNGKCWRWWEKWNKGVLYMTLNCEQGCPDLGHLFVWRLYVHVGPLFKPHEGSTWWNVHDQGWLDELEKVLKWNGKAFSPTVILSARRPSQRWY